MVAPARPSMSRFLRSSSVPSVPTRNNRPSPQIGQPVRREPVQPDRSRASAGVASVSSAKSSKPGGSVPKAPMVRPRSRHRRPGEGQKLIDRVHADIVDDAAIRRRIEEPRRPQVAVQPVRSERLVCTSRPSSPERTMRSASCTAGEASRPRQIDQMRPVSRTGARPRRAVRTW